MNDKIKIIIGLIIFVVLALFPFLGNLGNTTVPPEPVISSSAGTKCIESKEYMRANHMQILEDWRHAVVRDSDRSYVGTTSKDGRRHTKSLTNTCMDCHDNKAEFCDTCHDYTSVKPYCWECHVESKEKI
jgi:hypothetical protein